MNTEVCPDCGWDFYEICNCGYTPKPRKEKRVLSKVHEGITPKLPGNGLIRRGPEFDELYRDSSGKEGNSNGIV